MNLGKRYLRLKSKLKLDYLLTETQSIALINLKGNKCKEINLSILNESLNQDDYEFILDVNNALLNLPKTKSKTIFRNFNFSNEEFQNASSFFKTNVGKVIKFSTFLSCTKSKIFAGKQDYNFVIQINLNNESTGVDIELLLSYAEIIDAEKEIIYPNNTCFKIVRINMKKYIKVVLAEIPYTENSILVQKF
jgi:hypothetical protein